MSNFYINNMEVGFHENIARLEIGRWDGEPTGKPIDTRELYLAMVSDETIAEVASTKVAAIDWSETEAGARYFIDEALVLTRRPPQPSEYHVFNWQTKQWEDPRTLADLKAAQWTQIKQARTQAEYAGFTWNGSTFDSDVESQARINGAVTLALISKQASQPYSITWTLADNTLRVLSADDMISVGLALGTHVQTIFNKGQQLQQQIEATTTKEEIEAITWQI